YRKRFIQEAKAAARVSHPLLVDVSDIGGTDDGRLYFVMEYLEGCTLSEHLREHPGGLPWREAMVIALEIVKALEVAHRHDIVHRDVKPGNVFLKGGITRGPELQIKLLDLGIAKVHYEGRDEERPQTGTDGTPGTPEYMAPEQIRGGADSPSVDLYAVGVLTYRLLTGSLPFSAKTPWDVLAMHLNDEPPPILSRAPHAEIPAEVESLVMRLLSKRPGDRPASATALRRRIERLVRADERTTAAHAAAAGSSANELLLRLSTRIMRLVLAAVTFVGLTLLLPPERLRAQPGPRVASVTAKDASSPATGETSPVRREAATAPAPSAGPDDPTASASGSTGDDDYERLSPDELARLMGAPSPGQATRKKPETSRVPMLTEPDPERTRAAIREQLAALSFAECKSGLPTAIKLNLTVSLATGRVNATVAGIPSKKSSCVAEAVGKKRLTTAGSGQVSLVHQVKI
ncbi:MAG: protein kinase, partial [Myxococcales bacterium]|nr:protein kinase [Myxococcales bacterium]